MNSQLKLSLPDVFFLQSKPWEICDCKSKPLHGAHSARDVPLLFVVF